MKTAVVTGATSGIGFAVCKMLCESGYQVVGVGHSEKNSVSAMEKLASACKGGTVHFIWGDLVQQSEVRRVAGEIRAWLAEYSGGRLEALINNAGGVRSWYMTSDEGYEHQFALNHLAGFLLTHELLPNLAASGGKVLFTSSQSHKNTRMHWQDLMFQKRYNPLLAYKQSKLCNMLTVFALNERLSKSGIRVFGIDPGLVNTDIGNKQTGTLVNLAWRIQKCRGVPPEVSAQAFANALAQDIPQGEMYFDRKGAKPCSKQVNKENADRLYEISRNLCGMVSGEALP